MCSFLLDKDFSFFLELCRMKMMLNFVNEVKEGKEEEEIKIRI